MHGLPQPKSEFGATAGASAEGFIWAPLIPACTLARVPDAIAAVGIRGTAIRPGGPLLGPAGGRQAMLFEVETMAGSGRESMNSVKAAADNVSAVETNSIAFPRPM